MSQMYLRAKGGGLGPLRLQPQGARSRQRRTTERFSTWLIALRRQSTDFAFMKRANLNLFRLQSESIRPDGLSHVVGRYEVNLRLIEWSHAVGESFRGSVRSAPKPEFQSPRLASGPKSLQRPLSGFDLAGGDHRLGPAIDAELLQYGGDVRLDGRLRHAELIGDLLIEEPAREHHQHAHLLR